MQDAVKKLNNFVMPTLMLGYMTMGLVLFIWAGFSLTARAVGSSPLAIADVALIRFAVPLILLMPFVIKHLDAIKQVRLSDILFILLGGIPFLFFALWGAKSAPTAYVGTILAGTPPLFVALISCFFYKQVITKKRLFSLSLIFIGVLVMIFADKNELSTSLLQGVGFLVCGSIIWATYTIGLKRAAINAITVAIILSYLSFFIVFGLTISGVLHSNWGTFTIQEALPFVLAQGIGVGLLATIGFSYAVSQLGSARTSIMGALSPGIAALLAVPIFNEPLSTAIIFGICLTMAGVILSSRN